MNLFGKEYFLLIYLYISYHQSTIKFENEFSDGGVFKKTSGEKINIPFIMMIITIIVKIRAEKVLYTLYISCTKQNILCEGNEI